MIGVDTNVLVRYLVQDDPLQSKEANRIIENEKIIFINHIVLCELVWVLRRGYNYDKPTVTETLEKILLTRQFEIEEKNIAWHALTEFKKSSADYSDCLIGIKNQHAGCDFSFTFDQKAGSLSYFSRNK